MSTKLESGKCLLQYWLDKRGWEYSELVKKTGISKSQISQYIGSDRKMSLNNAATIAYALNITVEELYEWNRIKA